MAYPPNESRNRAIIILRETDPETYTFQELGRIFGITAQTVYRNYKRDFANYRIDGEMRIIPK